MGCSLFNPWKPVPAPHTFTQKALLEELTGTWCGYCPDGAAMAADLLEDYPGVVIAAAFHNEDEMAMGAQLTEFASGLGGKKFFPTGAVNRTLYSGNTDPDTPIFFSRSFWHAAVAQELAETASCGLKLSTRIIGGNAGITVSMGFRGIPPNTLRLSVYLIEDHVTGYDQINSYFDSGETPYYGPNPIHDFEFNHVFRGFVTPVSGDTVDLAVIDAGGGIERLYSHPIPAGCVPENITVIAMLHEYGPGVDGKRILNVQSVALGGIKEWD